MEFRVSNPEFQEKTQIDGNSVTFFYPGSSEFSSCPYVLTIPEGSYFFECWGAWGHSSGRPGYTSGTLDVNEATTFYLYIGAAFSTTKIPGIGYNGGGSGDRGGGGASDIRYINGLWDNFQSLKSRIMVAAGGGGVDCDGTGGFGGGLSGTDGLSSYAKGQGGAQTHGGVGYVNGGFGFGGSSFRIDESGNVLDNGGGGGGGYYGGGTGAVASGCSGGGGSSFISGYSGCDSINESSTYEYIIHTGQSMHFSGYVFSNTHMISGDNTMPLPNGNEGIGTYASGSIRVTSLNGSLILKCTDNHNFCNSLAAHGMIAHFILIFSVVEENGYNY